MIHWQSGWQPLGDHEKEEFLLRELAKEIEHNGNHPLWGKCLRAIGWIPGEDEILLELDGGEQFAYVHLTWSVEREAQFPYCEMMQNVEELNAFIERWRCDEAAS